MIQSKVLQEMVSKKAELEQRLAAMKAEQAALEAEVNSLTSGEQTAQEALATLEQLIADTPKDIKPHLFRLLFKALEQEAKRNGINLAAEAVSGNAANSEAGKRTRTTKNAIEEPELFQVFPNNNRLALDGFIKGDRVQYSKVYIGVDGLRTTSACQGSAVAWRDWLKGSGSITSQIKTGDFFTAATTNKLEGNYILELSEVSIHSLSKLVDLDFSKAPNSEENEQLMSQDYKELKFGEPEQEETDSEPEPDQVEEIRETETVEIQPIAPQENLYPVGTKFQVKNLTGFEGKYGEVVGLIPDSEKPYECEVQGFSYNPFLKHDMIEVIPEADEELDPDKIPF